MEDKKIKSEADTIIDKEIISEKIIEKQNRQILFTLILMIAVIVIIAAIPYINQNFINNFNYKGLDFKKTNFGNLVFFSSEFPVITPTGRVIGDYRVNLRNDPRKLDDFKVNLLNKDIQFALNIQNNTFGPVFISLNPSMKMCEDTIISLAALSAFLGDSGLNVKSAYTDLKFAKQNNGTYRECNTDYYDTVITVTDGNDTSITEEDANCYKLQFTNCEILKVTEKFQLLILETYSSFYQNKTLN